MSGDRGHNRAPTIQRSGWLRYVGSNHLVWATLLFALMAWVVRFGSGADFTTASYAGNLDEDAGQFIWHFLHFKKVVTGEASFFFSDRVFYPVGLQMVRQDWAPTAGLLALPFQFLLNPLGALNAQVWVAFFLCGLFTYLLAHRLCKDPLLALAAGVIFAFCEFRVDKSLGHINQANQQFIPLYLLFLLNFFGSGRWRHALGAAICFYLATFCTYYHLVFVLLTTVFYLFYLYGAAAWRTVRGRFWPGSAGRDAAKPAGVDSAVTPDTLRGLLGKTLIFTVICGLVCLPLFGPLLFNAWHGFTQAARSLTYTMPSYSADLLSYVMSNLYTPPPERLFSGEGGTAFAGYSTLALFALALVTVRRRTGAGPWVFLALVYFVISLGSTLVIAGEPVCELPVFKLLQALPVVAGAKVAARFASLVILCAALAGVVTVASLLRRHLRYRPALARGVRWTVLAVVCLEFLLPPFRFTLAALPIPYRPPPIYRAIAGLDPDIAVLQFPPVWDAFTGNIGPHRFPRQLFAHQTVHGKPIFSGIGNMVPASTLKYLTRLPFLREMIALGKGGELAKPSESAQHGRDARAVAATLDLRLVVVYKKMVIPGGDTFSENYDAAVRYLKRTVPLQRAYDDERLSLYVVDGPARGRDPADGLIVDLANEGSLVNLGGGFARVSRGQGWIAEAPLSAGEPLELFFRLRKGRDASLRLGARCLAGPCRFDLRLNGRRLGQQRVGQGWGELKVLLPAAQLKDGINRIYLDSGEAGAGRPVAVGRTGVSTTAAIQLASAGVEVGNWASIRVEERELIPNVRGYNIAALRPNGTPLAADGFDLVDDPGGVQARRLVQFIAAVPQGALVCVAVRDDGSINLTQEVVEALRTVGAAVDMRGRLRQSYALIGRKGAAPGTALERVSKRPLQLKLGRVLQLREIRVDLKK